jgi:hypothetical protein
MISGILGLFLLVADIWALFDVAQKAPTPAVKGIWAVIILVLPLLGLSLWFLTGPRGTGQ